MSTKSKSNTVLASINGECVTFELKRSGEMVMHHHGDSREYRIRDVTDPLTLKKASEALVSLMDQPTVPVVDTSITAEGELVF